MGNCGGFGSTNWSLKSLGARLGRGPNGASEALLPRRQCPLGRQQIPIVEPPFTGIPAPWALLGFCRNPGQAQSL